jgi:hypothetical protein
MYGARRLQDFVNSTRKFNTIVFMPKLLLCFSHDDASLKLKKEVKRFYSSSLQII